MVFHIRNPHNESNDIDRTNHNNINYNIKIGNRNISNRFTSNNHSNSINHMNNYI